MAVKLIRIDRLDPMTRKRFEKEALVARTVVGTNRVARFLDADPFADRPWLAMEYVPGKVLQAHVKEDGPLAAGAGGESRRSARRRHQRGTFRGAAAPRPQTPEHHPGRLRTGGHRLRARGVHRPVDRLALPDRARLSGTPACMSPEQAHGNPQVTTAADVYSLGTVLLYRGDRA